jgi:hypothetical protein
MEDEGEERIGITIEEDAVRILTTLPCLSLGEA